jgi:Transposase DDE domain
MARTRTQRKRLSNSWRCIFPAVLRGSHLSLDLANTVYALGSTTIDMCLSVFPWAHFRSTKSTVKMHTLLDLRGNIPSFIHISDGKLADVHALDLLTPEPGAIYVIDRGYVDFARLHAMHQTGAFFVTRAKSNMNFHRRYSAPTDRTTGIICDQTIVLDGHYARQHYPGRLRRIRFRDAETSKTLVFLTNNFDLRALTIAAVHAGTCWQPVSIARSGSARCLVLAACRTRVSGWFGASKFPSPSRQFDPQSTCVG